jgi:hypothetical protein
VCYELIFATNVLKKLNQRQRFLYFEELSKSGAHDVREDKVEEVALK